jgi:hypothetical protein
MTKSQITTDKLISKLTKAYPTIDIKEIGFGSVEKVIINAEESPEDRDGLQIFSYYTEDYSETYYIFGVRKHLHNFLERNGWYAEWVNSYTIALYKG